MEKTTKGNTTKERRVKRGKRGKLGNDHKHTNGERRGETGTTSGRERREERRRERRVKIGPKQKNTNGRERREREREREREEKGTTSSTAVDRRTVEAATGTFIKTTTCLDRSNKKY